MRKEDETPDVDWRRDLVVVHPMEHVMLIHGVQVPVFQLLQWKHALRLEIKGLKMSRGRSVSAHVKGLLGLSKSMRKAAVLAKVEAWLEAYWKQRKEHEDGRDQTVSEGH